MKNLKPVSKEPHEIIIELHEEYDYLVKRLTALGANSLLQTDSEYMNAIYLHLPETHKLIWDEYQIEDYDSEWQAFAVFFEEKYETALRKRTRMESLKDMTRRVPDDKSKGAKCFNCLEVGHKSKNCPKKIKEVK